MQLAALGVTILVASGGNGAPGDYAQPGLCGYYADYPASSPYVTAVGATIFINSVEVACQTSTGDATNL